MGVSRGLWVPINTGDIGTTEVEARLADAGLFAENGPGIPRSGLLNPGTPNVVTGTGTMNYAIAPCKPVLNRVTNEGVYRWSIDAATTVPTTAAPGSNSRIDIIWTKQNDQSKGDADNLAIVGCSQGVAAPVPSAPTIPVGALELARATVPALVTGTSSASITQTFQYTALRGAPVPVRNDAERGTGLAVGSRVKRLDTTALVEEEWDGTAWRLVTGAQGLKVRNVMDTADATGQVANVVLQSIPSFTFKGGRNYLIGIEHNHYVTNVDTVWLQTINLAPVGDAAGSLSNLTPLNRTDHAARTGNRAYPAYLYAWYSPATDITRQVKVTGVRVEGTGSFAIQRAAATPASLFIEDKGAST